MNTGYSWLVTD